MASRTMIRVCTTSVRVCEVLSMNCGKGCHPFIGKAKYCHAVIYSPYKRKSCVSLGAPLWPPPTCLIRRLNSSSSSSADPPSGNVSTTITKVIEDTPIEGEVSVEYFRGLPQVTVPLPSRKEHCRFTLRPVTHTVGDFLRMIQEEDRGVDRIAVKSLDGTRIASSNNIENLMEQNFHLIINNSIFHVQTPQQERLTMEEIERLSDVRNLVNQLYEALNVEEHQLRKERELCSELEELKVQLEPLEKQCIELQESSDRRVEFLTWGFLGYMAVQFGILARLTWWEYSWDIMEPVTYFVTYGTSMVAFAYYVLTKQEYILPDVRDRQFLFSFHKRARKAGFDTEKYNKLKDSIHKLEVDLGKLRDPSQIHLPQTHIESLSKSSPLEKAQAQLKNLINRKLKS